MAIQFAHTNLAKSYIPRNIINLLNFQISQLIFFSLSNANKFSIQLLKLIIYYPQIWLIKVKHHLTTSSMILVSHAKFYFFHRNVGFHHFNQVWELIWLVASRFKTFYANYHYHILQKKRLSQGSNKSGGGPKGSLGCGPLLEISISGLTKYSLHPKY